MKIAFCITEATTYKELNDYMTELTTYYAHRMNVVIQNRADIVYAKNVDAGLKNYSSKYDYILYMSAGCRILLDNVIEDILKEIQNNSNFLCAAHILDWTNKGEWYELHEQFILVNVNTWREINYPKFGGWTNKTSEVPVIERSVENFHDDYTPLWIKDSGDRKMQKYSHPGWNFLIQGLKFGCDIINWNEEIRSKRTYYYPDTDSQLFWKCIKSKMLDPKITNFNQNKFLQFIRNGVQDQIWLYNSEEISLNNKGQKYDTIALPASGFKYLDVFKSDMLSEDGKLIIYDFSGKALEWIKTIHQSQEYNIESIASKFPHQKMFKQVKGYGYQKTLEYFEDEHKFNSYLERFRKMDVVFAEVDLIQKPGPLIQELQGRAFIHISNIFSTDWLIANFGLKFAEEKIRSFYTNVGDNVTVSGVAPTPIDPSV